MEFTTGFIEKAKAAETAEELLEMAKAENMEMTAEEAAQMLDTLHKTVELSDEELDNVAGGARSQSEYDHRFDIGERVKVKGRDGKYIYEGVIKSHCKIGPTVYYDFGNCDYATVPESMLIRA